MSRYYITCKGLLPIFSQVCDCVTATSLCGSVPDENCNEYILCKGSEKIEPFPYFPKNEVDFGDPISTSAVEAIESAAIQSKHDRPLIVLVDVDPLKHDTFESITDLLSSCDSLKGKRLAKLKDSGRYFIFDSELKVVEENGEVKIAEVFTPEEKKEAEKSIQGEPDAKVKKDEDGNIVITDSDKDSYSYKKEGDQFTILKNGEPAYTVSKTENGGYKCTCTGFKYRGRCRHIDAIKAIENNRKPRESVDEFMPEIEKVFNDLGKWEVVGSYRRKSPTVKDIDILVQCEPDKFKIIEERFQEDPNYEHVMSGSDIIRGKYHGMDMDVTRVNEGEWGSYLLYRTGSAAFNIKMRADAKKRGWKLNEHGLWDENGDKLASETEEDIFESLGMKYVKPENRK